MPGSRYIPALSFNWLTPVYDPLIRWGMREQVFKRRLLERAQVRPGQHVLDLGCGTGTLTIMLKLSEPQATVVGLDGDAQILSIAETKAAQAGAKIFWDLGLAYNLPYNDRSFDVVLSSLMIHHLSSADKLRAFREVRRVLKPGGAFHIVDFGRPNNVADRLQAAFMRQWERAADNFDGRIVPILQEAGFESTGERDPMGTIFGPIWFYQAVKPGSLAVSGDA